MDAPTPSTPAREVRSDDPSSPEPLLEVENLRVEFARPGWLFSRSEPLVAVRDVSFSIQPGETLGLVGESGSGKTTVGRAVLRLQPVVGGRVTFRGEDVLGLTGESLRQHRKHMQIVFQDPASSLNPRLRVWQIITEPLLVHKIERSPRALRAAARDLLHRCGLERDAADRFPHEFSGGQRQRIGIARALALEPRLIVCDEPTSALDVSVQASLINLMTDLQNELGLSYLFISHDIGVISHVSHRVAVMKSGEIVEIGDRDAVLNSPEHPYTQRLLAAVPAIPTPA